MTPTKDLWGDTSANLMSFIFIAPHAQLSTKQVFS